MLARPRRWSHNRRAPSPIARHVEVTNRRQFRTRRLLLVVVIAAGALGLAPHDARGQASDTTAASALRVFLDCPAWVCDFDFVRAELSSVNWVRDRQVSDVQILVTTQATGSGGTEYTLTFLGRGRAEGLGDTLRYAAIPSEAPDVTRRALLQRMRIALARFVAHVSGPGAVTVTFGAEGKSGTAQQTKPGRDPWHYWVFQTSVNGFMNGEATQGFRNFFGSTTANRVTERWKTNIGFNESYNDSRFDIPDSTVPSGTRTVTNVQRSYGIDLLQVKSLSSHWSVGATASINSSMYLNEHRAYSISPAIEYDVFPYSESTRRQVRIMYAVGTSTYEYNDTTIFLKTHETIPFQRLTAAVGINQAWGSVNVTGNANWFLADPAKRSSGLFGSVSLRLVKGLALNVGGSLNSIRDQVYLPKEPGTDEQILLQERQRATSYRYFVVFGLSYTFGSIYNNVVNPRFGNGGGQMISF